MQVDTTLSPEEVGRGDLAAAAAVPQVEAGQETQERQIAAAVAEAEIILVLEAQAVQAS